mmetsp:Transcript_24442/g.64284  ORF Transcript_24442/g.64284 Transcript_24442/m.64284 type:complete len:92 (+) Transcript_24442:127-402(+)
MIFLPWTMSVACADAVAGKLVVRGTGDGVCARHDHRRKRRSLGDEHQVLDSVADVAMPDSCEVVSVADHSNWQAVCTAFVLKELLNCTSHC